MARIPILQSPTAQATGNATIKTPNLPAVTNAAFGEALSNIGQTGFKMIEMKKKADDISNVTAATLLMNDADKQFLDYQRSPEGMNDDANWANKWSEISSKIADDTKSMSLTPEARLQLESKLSNWSTNGAIRIQADVFKQSEARVLNSIQALTDAQKFPEARAVVDAAKSFIPQTQIDQLNNKITQFERQTSETYLSNVMTNANKYQTPDDYRKVAQVAEAMHKNGFLDDQNYALFKDANAKDILDAENLVDQKRDPRINMARFNDPTYMSHRSAEDKFKLRIQAQNTLLKYQEDEQKKIIDKVYNNEIKDAEQAKNHYNYMDDNQRRDFEKVFRYSTPSNPSDAEMLHGLVTARIESYDPDEDKDYKKKFQILNEIQGLTDYNPTMGGQLKEFLNEKIKSGKPIGFSTYAETVTASLTDAYKSGKFGDIGKEGSDKDILKREEARQKMREAKARIQRVWDQTPKEKQNEELINSLIIQTLTGALIENGALSINKKPTQSSSASIASAAAAAGGTGGAGMAAMTNRKEEEEEVPQPDNSPLVLPTAGKDKDQNPLLPVAIDESDWETTARGNTSRILAEKEKLENSTKSK